MKTNKGKFVGRTNKINKDNEFIRLVDWASSDEDCTFVSTTYDNLYCEWCRSEPVSWDDLISASNQIKDFKIKSLLNANGTLRELLYEQLKENELLRETLEQIQTLIKKTE